MTEADLARHLIFTEWWMIVAPFAMLVSIYSWDYGMDMLVP